ncbi:TonB-dependent receptor [Comamonas thiooxydans]|uniref:TonB-denpendent receptor n=1 Tax=Comamonas thiooxydans TaxID=363952 RepID=A0A0E3BZM8_9BURK|nr:TonB-dependent siderophore receptor [Comamonas thiooxydans]KGH10669.1 TonB-denpendent receptor [Comamonas thiooxydans]KGH20001.1 TonB-denpendent receptor [Comamonas thiooxydans]KGH26411.1 TonB-denpendent receptor [Comamonas thiooxydans]
MALRYSPLAAALGLAFSGAAWAQQASEVVLEEVQVRSDRQPDSGYNPPTATSATKIEAPLRDIPQTVNVVPQSLLRDQVAQSMQDALKAVPGVGFSHGDGQRDQVTIRGFSAIADQFVDGLRDDALYFRDLSNIEQIEVLKGPASVLYGRGSSGGLINRITKKPGVNLSEVGLTLGRWNQRRGEFDLARAPQDSAVSYRLTGAVERADSYRDQQFLDRKALAASVLIKPSSDTSVLLQADYLKDSRLTDFGIPAYQGRPVNVSPGTYYGAANARDVDVSRAEVASLGATLNHRISDSLSLRNALRYYDYSLDRNNTLVGSVNEKAMTASLTRGNVQRDESGFFNQTELTQKLEFAGVKHQLLYGFEFGRQSKDLLSYSRANVATVSLFNPVLPTLPLRIDGKPAADNHSVFKVASAYLQDLVTISPQWKALAGVRYDRFQQETHERQPGKPDLSRTDTAWSPRVGLVYQPSSAWSYYASWSKSFQPSGETFALAANNAQLAPEKTTSQEVGVKWDLQDGKASVTASLFKLERTNIKSVDPTSNTVVPLGVQRTNGLELTFAGEIVPTWQVWAGYAFLDGEMTTSPAVDSGQPVQGKRPTLTPRQSANLWVTKALGHGFGLGGGLNYVGARFANPGNTVTLPGYTTVDAMAYYRMGPWDVQLKLNNLLNRRYIVAGHGSSPNLNLPGAPRSAQVVARYRF